MTNFDFTGAYVNHYKIIKLIGTGAYGLVFLVQNTRTNGLFAMKVIAKKLKKDCEKQSEYLSMLLYSNLSCLQNLNTFNLAKLSQPLLINQRHPFFLKEINMHLQVHQHPNVISIHEIFDSPFAVFVFMDYFPEGDLFTNVVDNARYINSSPSLIKRVFTQLVDAILYCHSKGIYHCDIKPENIMCTSNGEFLAIADFGLSTSERFLSSNVCIGSSYYMAPERVKAKGSTRLIEEKYPSNMGDLWSLAIILINLTCMRNPWNKASIESDKTYRAFRQNNNVLKDILPISEELYEILIGCLRENPYERISLSQLREKVIDCKAFTKEGPLSQEDTMDSESEYLTSDADSLNSYDHHKDELELELELEDYETHEYQIDPIEKFNKAGLDFDIGSIVPCDPQSTQDNFSTISIASFNINYESRRNTIPLFH